MRKPLPTQFSGPFASPGFLLWRVSNAWQREQRAALQPLGITHTQFVALAVATWFSHDEPLTQVRLAQLTGSDPMTISQVVRALEAAGHFSREDHPTDTRAKVIAVSAAGRELAAQAVQVVEAADAAFFAALGGDQAALLGMFQRLLGGGQDAGDTQQDNDE